MIDKHTPGPWVWNNMRTKLVGQNNEVVLQDGEGMWDLLATADNRQAEVNASLVAAAPDLLEALYTALPFVEDAMFDDCYKRSRVTEAIRVIKAAIAKATGVNHE